VVAVELLAGFAVGDEFDEDRHHHRHHHVSPDAGSAGGGFAVVNPRSLFDDPLHPRASQLFEGGEGLVRSGQVAQALGELHGRQRSLDSAIGWSYQLLAPDERRLWRGLSVFVGGFELDAAAWRVRFEQEQANLRAALDACVRAGDARTGMAIFTGLYGLWQTPAGFSEGLHWFDVLIALNGPEDDIRALALGWAVWMRTVSGDLAGAMHVGREAERIARRIGDAAALGFALQNLAFAHLAAGQALAAIDLARCAVESHRSVATEWGVAGALHHLAYAHYVLGNRPQSRVFAEEALRLCEAAGNRRFGMAPSVLLALLAWQDGEVTTAAALARDSIGAACSAGDQWNIARALQLLGWSAAAAGQPERAAALLGGSQSLLDSIQDESDLSRLMSSARLRAWPSWPSEKTPTHSSSRRATACRSRTSSDTH